MFFVVRAWWGVEQTQPGAIHVCLTQRSPVERTLMSINLGDGCAPDTPSKWRKGTLLTSWLNSSSPGPLMLQTSWASFLQSMSEGCVGSHSRRIRDNRALSRTPPFCSRSTASPRDTWLADVGLGRRPTPWRRAWQKAREKYACPLVVRDREYPFREDMFPDASGNADPQLPMLAKVSCLVDALQLGGSYRLVERPWERLVLTASRINVTVAWSRDEVLVSSVLSPDSKWSNWF